MNSPEINVIALDGVDAIAEEFIRTIFYAFYSQFLKIVNSNIADTDEKPIEQTSYPPQTP